MEKHYVVHLKLIQHRIPDIKINISGQITDVQGEKQEQRLKDIWGIL